MCVKTITNALLKLKGIKNININLGTEKALITYDPEIINLEIIKNKINSLGYEYLGSDDSEIQSLNEFNSKLKFRLYKIYLGFIVGILLMILMYMKVSFIDKHILMLIISFPFFIYLSFPIFKSGIMSLFNKTLSMDLMYSMGIGISYLSSILGTFNILLDHNFIYYESAIFLAVFLNLGKYLEEKAKNKTNSTIKKLIELSPKSATVLRNNIELFLPIDSILKDDIVLIKPGDKIPVDGIIIQGESYVNESMITGEPLPVFKTINSKLLAGTINQDGSVKLQTTGVGKDTFLNHIIALVDQAQNSRLPIQKYADTLIQYFIPIILLVAFIVFSIWYFLMGYPLSFSLSIFISILVIACPCALGLATPTAVTVGLGKAASLGILIKNGEKIEIVSKIKHFVFDKTGTLTKGEPQVKDIFPINISLDKLLSIAYSMESLSNHPLSQAIIKEAKLINAQLLKVDNFISTGGKGLTGIVDKNNIIIGNKNFILENNIEINHELTNRIINYEKDGKTIILIASSNKIIGIISIMDTIKDSAKTAINTLINWGLDITMISGDNESAARGIGKQLNITNIFSEVLPEQKQNEIKKLQNNGSLVAFIGDGINDSPAMVQSNLGIALGKGTDIAIEAGDIILIKDDLNNIPVLIDLSKKIMKKIKQNLFWALFYNMLLIPIAGGLLYPMWGITLKPEYAGFAMALSSVTVISFSLRLKKYKPNFYTPASTEAEAST